MVNEKILKAFKEEMESGYVRGIEDINDEIKFTGKKGKIFITDDINFRIFYLPETESYKLETSFSNQDITDEWVGQLNRIRKIIKQA